MYVIECLQTKTTPKKPSRHSEENLSALLFALCFDNSSNVKIQGMVNLLVSYLLRGYVVAHCI